MSEPSSETLAKWLAGTAITLDAEGIKAYQGAIGHVLAKASTKELLDLVALAHRSSGPSPAVWFAELARAKHPDIPLTDNDELLAQLAGAAVVRALAVEYPRRTLVGLAVHSAAFLGFTPVRPEVTMFADAAIAQAGDAVRARNVYPNPVAGQIPGWADEGSLPATEQAPGSGRPAWEMPILRVAEALDALAAGVRDRLALIDEEYDLLWWSHTGRSAIADLPWSEIDPPEKRTVLVAHELGEKVKRIPATAMVDGLAAVALGDQATKALPLTDIVAAVRRTGLIVASVEHTLLPISTGVAQAAVHDDDTWIKVLMRVRKVNVEDTHAASAIARQMIRERHIGQLL